MKDSGVEWLGQIPEGWIVCRLGRQIELQRGVDTTKETQNDGDIPVVSSGGISSYHDRAFASGPGVVVGRKGTAGSVHYIDSAFWPHDTTLWVKQFRGNHPKFVYYKLRSMNLGSFDTGSANPTLNRNLIHPVIVSWPLPIEQPVIAARLDCETTRIDAMAAKIDSSMTLLREYRTALISAAVTGKIDVRGCGEYPEAAATEMLLAAEALAEYGSPGGS
jgi:type I restriction enzyme S subunit